MQTHGYKGCVSSILPTLAVLIVTVLDWCNVAVVTISIVGMEEHLNFIVFGVATPVQSMKMAIFMICKVLVICNLHSIFLKGEHNV
jgi:hypothetical protein